MERVLTGCGMSTASLSCRCCQNNANVGLKASQATMIRQRAKAKVNTRSHSLGATCSQVDLACPQNGLKHFSYACMTMEILMRLGCVCVVQIHEVVQI
jgi:hypothetical protein